MYNKKLFLALAALLIATSDAAKKTRRKRPKSEEDSTLQPNVVTYSTFGFNDVGAYEGFVPSSPDYSSYMNNYQESSTRLYAPAFPTAMDSPEFNNYGSQHQDATATGPSDDSMPQASMLQYPQSSVSFYNTPSLDASEPRNPIGASSEIYIQNSGDGGSPIYGTKIGSKFRSRPSQSNNTEYNTFSSGPSNPSEVKYSTFHEVHSTYEAPKPLHYGESSKNYPNSFNYVSTYQSTDTEEMKPTTTTIQSPLKFPKVIDFTKYKQYYPTEVENKFTTSTSKPTTPYNPWPNPPSLKNVESPYTNNFEDYRTKFPNPGSTFGQIFKEKDVEEHPETTTPKVMLHTEVDYSQNYFSHSKNKDNIKDSKYNYDFKDKFKYKPWLNSSDDYKSFKNPFKGYQYSTDVSNMTFEFDFTGVKNPSTSNNDEIVPASSNIVDLASYRFPENDYSSFKKLPPIRGTFGDTKNYADDFENIFKNNKYDPEEYVRSLYSTVPTTTSLWGNVYKSPEYNFRHQPKKPQFVDEISEDIVHIPKRPYGNKYNFGKYSESKPTDWGSLNRPYKPKKNKESTRFKSEEDLLGLRTHDTSHPSYLPTYRPGNFISEDYDYKKLVEKWRQSYLKAKYKEAANDYEHYPSESKPIHVPVPKPYPIEIPHPVIVPVPRPYPVRVPVPRPVAVPMVRELTVHIEKPVPYPVIKKVPYPVEKPVPVPVEKEVKVPVMKPYPVPVPYIRPVFHHTRPREEPEQEEEDDYMPRPETAKRIPYAKRVKSIRLRSRRPTQQYHYQDRNRRRWPSRRPADHRPRPDPRAPYFGSTRHHEDFEEDYERSDYAHCKRTGHC